MRLRRAPGRCHQALETEPLRLQTKRTARIQRGSAGKVPPQPRTRQTRSSLRKQTIVRLRSAASQRGTRRRMQMPRQRPMPPSTPHLQTKSSTGAVQTLMMLPLRKCRRMLMTAETRSHSGPGPQRARILSELRQNYCLVTTQTRRRGHSIARKDLQAGIARRRKVLDSLFAYRQIHSALEERLLLAHSLPNVVPQDPLLSSSASSLSNCTSVVAADCHPSQQSHPT